jgi:hypothetical protein
MAVTQACTILVGGDLMDFMGGCTLIVDPFGLVRYAVYKRLNSDDRMRRHHAVVKGQLRRYWRKKDDRFVMVGGTFRMMHEADEERSEERRPGAPR